MALNQKKVMNQNKSDMNYMMNAISKSESV
jgi:hypothetical protein